MKSAPFAYHAPTSLDEALDLLGEEGVLPLAGGQSLMPSMARRDLRVDGLVDLNRIDGLAAIEEGGDGSLAIGAMARHRELERGQRIVAGAPLLADAARYVASPAVRNRGTVGGSVAQADPSGEIITALIALDATALLRGRGGAARELPVAELAGSAGGRPGRPDELLVEVRIPGDGGRYGWAYAEVNRRHNAPAIAGVAAGVRLGPDGDGGIEDARLALAGVEERPRRLTEAEDAIRGEAPGAARFDLAAQTAASALVAPRADLHASADYRRHVTAVLVRRALERATARARAEGAEA